MKVADRFLKYVSMDTQSQEGAGTVPSTEKQWDLARFLAEEMKRMGLADVAVDAHACATATLPANIPDCKAPVIGFLAHLDTSPDLSGADVKPRVLRYEGGDIVLNEAEQIVMRAADFESLASVQGHDLIVTDGTTLLGSDDKAGIAEILTAVEYLLDHPEVPHGTVKVAFTADEEIGGGIDEFNVKAFGADFAYTVDGGPADELEYENFNGRPATVTVKGFNIHPGSSKNKMVNASLIGIEFNNLLPPAEIPAHTEGYEGFQHLMRFDGSVEHTQLSYILRDHDLSKLERKEELFRAAAAFLNRKYGEGTVAVEFGEGYQNMKEKILPHFHLIDTARQALQDVGLAPRTIPIRGGTDGARLSFCGLPCPNLGTGGCNAHGRFEYASIQQMELMTQAIVKIIEAYGQMDRGAL